MTGTLFLAVLKLVGAFSIFGIGFFFFLAGFLCAYAVKLVRSSADGEKQPPDWPSIIDFWTDIALPLVQVLVTITISFGPLLGYLYLTFGDGMSAVPGLALGLLAFGIVYFPMAFLAMSVSGSVEYANPVFVISGIVKIGPTYLIACVVLCLVFVIEGVLQTVFASIPFVGWVANQLLSLYFLMVECRIIGLLYFANMRRLHWFGEA